MKCLKIYRHVLLPLLHQKILNFTIFSPAACKDIFTQKPAGRSRANACNVPDERYNGSERRRGYRSGSGCTPAVVQPAKNHGIYILDGNSEIGARIRSSLCYLILFDLIENCTNRLCFLRRDLFQQTKFYQEYLAPAFSLIKLNFFVSTLHAKTVFN